MGSAEGYENLTEYSFRQNTAAASIYSMEKITSILNAARDLFAEKGFDQTPVSDIAKRAGVAGGTIIYHFKNKENLLFILIRQILYTLFRQTQDEMNRAATGLEAVECYLQAFFAFLKSRRNDFKVLLKTNPFEIINLQSHPNADLKLIFERYLELLIEAIRRGQKDGSIRDCNASHRARAIFALLFGSGQMVVFFGEESAMLLEQATTLANNSLAVDDANPPPKS